VKERKIWGSSLKVRVRRRGKVGRERESLGDRMVSEVETGPVGNFFLEK
jgi:hypothetical protein